MKDMFLQMTKMSDQRAKLVAASIPKKCGCRPLQDISKTFALSLSFMMLALLAGCSSIGPSSVTRDRFDYAGAISDSWKKQMLLNLLKVRYSDAPVFLEVSSVINSYTLVGEGYLRGEWAAPGRGDQYGQAGLLGRYEDRPTITYAPLTGDKFARSLLTPIPIPGLLYLLQSGYPADLVLRMTVNTMNGLQNAYGGLGNPNPGDPGFFELIEKVRISQSEGGLGFRIRNVGENQVIVIFLRPETSEKVAAANRRIGELLGLDPAARELTILFGAYPADNQEIAIITRSMLQILTDIASYIEVPPIDAAERRVFVKTRSSEELSMAPPLVRIRQGEEVPQDAHAATRYRGRWFWIDDNDVSSKALFNFLMYMFALTETGEPKSGAPIVTVPAR